MRGAWVVAIAAGCYAPVPPEGAPCGDSMRCPSGQTCSPLDNRCYDDPDPTSRDADPPGGDTPDAPPMTTCTPRRLLGNGNPITAGWELVRVGSGSISVSNGMVTLMTSGNSRQLLVLRNAFPPDRWALDMVVRVISSGGHSANNAAVALMASFHDPVGSDEDRKRMLYLDIDKFGWGDGGVSIGLATTTTQTYHFERTSTGGLKASVGGTTLSVGSWTSNGTIAIGDQTSNAGLDSTLEIQSVDLTCQ